MKKRNNKPACLALFYLGFLLLLGIAGGLEGEMITLGQACLWAALDLSVMGALIVLGRLYESEVDV